ncbi:DUF4377 domain-containing protein [Psychrobacter sp. DAB_AL32B]|uniref:DUF4377 domain-containing protein n=1 Tax=Psychrobacter sp. DAB_AL32B TaxID=1028414 RepID=UPI000B7FE820|nr:DUF4377 domain-containing protein [Psychrobacter sp. DAB_AL32B]OXL24914.1 hypothetical protein CAN34_04945 [Psychrobacter sp. DAB_AL32B]
MPFIRLCTLALIASSSLAACSSYEQTNMNNKTTVSQIKDSNSFIRSIKPSRSEAIIGQVTGIISQDREQQKVTIVDQDGHAYTAFISKSNFGQNNANQMQKLAIGDYIEVMGEQSASQSGVGNKRQITVRAMSYVLRKILIADHQVDCVGVAPQSCLLTKPAEQANSDWEYRYSAIEGFDYEPHYEYTLLIKNTPVSNPPADASSVHSKLIKVLEKKKTKT